MKKNKKKFPFQSRNWSTGDLVKIKPSNWDGRLDEGLGIVINQVTNSAGTLFPSAVVYDMRKDRIYQFYLYDLELISSAT